MSQISFLRWAKSPHWHVSLLNNLANIPVLIVAGLLGSEWLSNYKMVKNIAGHNCNSVYSSPMCPKKLRQWMAHQRYCYTLKYHRSVSLTPESRSSVRSAFWSLTYFREAKLHEINFHFVVPRDAGRNQCKWLTRFAELNLFFTMNHHSNVTQSCNPKLYSWLCT